MNSVVPHKMGTPAICLPTCAADIRLFSLVDNEPRVVAEEFSTYTALIRPCSSVNFLVLNKVRATNVGFSILTHKAWLQCELSGEE